MTESIARRNDDSELVLIVQRKLQGLGLYPGPCDGHFGQALQAAIHRFQAQWGLPRRMHLDRATWELLVREAGFTFDEVLRDELAALGKNGTQAEQDHAAPAFHDEVTQAAHKAALAGLAFSGGGVRSATFNLGILQALGQAGLLRQFDYLSTVSGGGYIGGWLSRWIAEHPQGLAGVERELGESVISGDEPRQVKFLRQYSNFLAPRTGLFSTDTWALFATYFRNAFLNLLILSCALAAVLIVPRLWVSAVEAWHIEYADMFALVGAGAYLFAILFIALALALRPDPRARHMLGQGWVMLLIVLPLMVGAASGSVAAWQYRNVITGPWNAVLEHGFSPAALVGGLAREVPWASEDQLILMLLGPGLCYFAAWATGWGIAQYLNRSRTGDRPRSLRSFFKRYGVLGLGHMLCAVGALAIGTLLLVASAAWLGGLDAAPAGDYSIVLVASFGMSYMLSIFGVMMVLMIGLIGRLYSEQSREWWSRQGGGTIIYVLFWLTLFAFSLFGPAVAVAALNALPETLRPLASAGWIGTVWASVWAAKHPSSGTPRANMWLDGLALCAPPLLSITVLTLIATSIQLALTPNSDLPPNSDLVTILGSQMIDTVRTLPSHLGWGLAVCLAVFLLFSFRVDVNKFSLYMMYRNRLVRTYLGAINAHRMPHPFTGFDSSDELPLQRIGGEPGKPQRPYQIINAALNLVSGQELAWQTRKAANFTFTPLFCGFETPSMPVSATAQAAAETARGLFRPTAACGVHSTDPEASEKGVKLGMAMAISGAAASPSMGYHSSPVLTFVLTLFNVRLGRWCGNPGTREAWRRASPPSGFYYLVKELLGLTNASSNFLYLSDGAHFEDLGIYELVRRRCRLIVAVDTSADRALEFCELGNALRKCYTDLHVEIDLDIRKLEPAAGTGLSGAYCVAGKIMYSRCDKNAPDGTLLYIKPGLIGDERAEIYNYHKTNPDFPYQSVADQQLDETRFETYRALGHHIGRAIFSRLAAGNHAGGPASTKRLCAEIERHWLAGEHGQGAPRRPSARPNQHGWLGFARKIGLPVNGTADQPNRGGPT